MDVSESESMHEEGSDGNTGRDPWLEADDTDTSDEEVGSYVCKTMSLFDYNETLIAFFCRKFVTQ